MNRHMLSTLSWLAATVFVATFAQPLIARAPEQESGSRGTKAVASVAALNLNTASASDLETLPGVGAKTAARIVAYRQKNGPFKKVEDLMNVQGIGEKSFLRLKPQISVAAAKGEPTPQQD